MMDLMDERNFGARCLCGHIIGEHNLDGRCGVYLPDTAIRCSCPGEQPRAAQVQLAGKPVRR